MIIVDAHEDLAYSILAFNRDYTLAVQETRRRESGSLTPARNGDTLLGWPEYQQGSVALVFGTLFAPPARLKEGEWEVLTYQDSNAAHRLYSAQLDTYHRLADQHADKFLLVRSQKELDELLGLWVTEPPQGVGHPVGIVVLMEGAEGVRSPGELEQWWERGVRLIGPAWAGTRFCGGTREPGPLTREGYQLLEGMAAHGFGLDLSHMDEEAALQALDVYPGPILASHANAKALLKGTDSNRFLSDQLIRGLLERQGVIGIVPYNNFLKAGWRRGDNRQEVTLQHVVAQIDYICQAAGDARHVGLGSDFDGGFGLQSVPAEIDTVADLQKLVPLLAERGYTQADIAAILGENWLGVLRQVL